MKHIAIIPNYSGITGMIKDGEISPNFLVKSENDQKVYFSNSNGYKLVVSGGDTYNMYKVGPSGFEHLEASFAGTNHIAFQILDANGVPVTTRFDWYCGADNHSDPNCPGDNFTYEGNETGVTDFEVDWAQIQDLGSGDTYVGYQVSFEPDGVDPHVNVMGFYYMTDEEVCSCAGGTWDPVNQECVMPTCEEQGLCDDGAGGCVECEQEGCGGDPECECNDDIYNWWDITDETCHSCGEEWESLGYSSPEECARDKRGATCEDLGRCDDGAGGCVECEEEGCGGDPECECNEQGGTWDGEECQFE